MYFCTNHEKLYFRCICYEPVLSQLWRLDHVHFNPRLRPKPLHPNWFWAENYFSEMLKFVKNFLKISKFSGQQNQSQLIPSRLDNLLSQNHGLNLIDSMNWIGSIFSFMILEILNSTNRPNSRVVLTQPVVGSFWTTWRRVQIKPVVLSKRILEHNKKLIVYHRKTIIYVFFSWRILKTKYVSDQFEMLVTGI